MSATKIDLRLSKALAPRPFDESRVGDLTLDPADQAMTGTNARPLQPWRVARVHHVERLGELFRCEVIITRRENLRNDPNVPPPPQNTVFDDVSNAIDDGDGVAGDDLQSIDDALDSGLGSWSNPAAIPGNINAIVNALNAASGVATNTFNTVQQGFQNQSLEQYLLGIPPGTPWTPEAPPKPGVFLGQLYSLLVTRNGQGNVPLAGRWITGLVTEFEDLGLAATGHRLVRLVIEPQLARLALRTNHRVFERLDAMAIVKTILDEAGIYGADFAPPGTYAPRRWCIQYGETDLDFVMRLFSEEGLVPVFEHHLGAERMKLVVPEELQMGQGCIGYGLAGVVETLDRLDVPRATPFELLHATAMDAAVEEVAWDYGVRRAVRSTGAAVRSTDFSTSYAGPSEIPTHVRSGDYPAPDAEVALDLAVADRAQSDLHLFPARTSFDFDPDTAVQTDAVDPNKEARLETIAARAEATLGRGRTNAVGLSTGQRVVVTHGLPLIDPNIYDAAVSPLGQFVITRLELIAQNQVVPPVAPLPPAPPAFMTPAAPLGLEAVFETVPDAALYLPPRRRAPRVDGVQTAITRCSPAPWQEGHGRIGVDPIGRVRASLPWDRRPIHPDTGEQPLSPPIRLATPWAGHAWGTTFLPREGMELLVAYLDGDPTQPIGLGCLHGFVNPAPRERPHIAHRDARNRLDPKEEKLLGDDEKRLHYDPKKKKRPAAGEGVTPHLNAIRTAIHPAPKDEAYKAFHELSFEDTPGKERVRLHSSGVLSERAMHDMRTYVGRDQMNVVQGKQTEKIGANASLVVEGQRTKVVTGHEDRDVKGRQDITVKGTKSLLVHEDLERWVGSETPSEDQHEIGLEPGAGAVRQLTSKRDRHTKIQGDDSREVGGDVRVRCGETYELGGAPLDMKSTEKSEEGGAGLSTDTETGETVLDGATGECELVADGKVTVEADTIDLSGATAVRFECGEVSMEMTADEVIMKAPGGVAFYFSGRPMNGVPATTASLEMEAPGGAVTWSLADHGATEGGKFTALIRAGKASGEYMDAEDALEGDPGVRVAPVDSFVIKGGLSAFACRRVEMQKEGGPKHVHREETQDEKDLLERIGELKKKIEELEKKRDRAVEDRDAAREEYLEAAKKRKAAEERIKEDDGIDEELGDAIDRVTAAEKNLQKAKRDEQRARDEYQHAFSTGQNTDDEEEALDDAKEAVEEAEEELEEAEEQLEETREEHGGLMDEYVATRDEEEQKAKALTDAQDEVVRAQNELRAAERELADAEREAANLELFDDEQEAAE